MAKKAIRPARRKERVGARRGRVARRTAGPRPARPRPAAAAPLAAPAPSSAPDTSRPRALAAARAALDKKAGDVLVLDVRGLASYADYFVLATADSERQAAAVADHVDEQLEAEGARKVGLEGYPQGRWILVDYGDVVTHVLSPEARALYDLEGLWVDAPRVKVV
jgi:ribosome-associated protein